MKIELTIENYWIKDSNGARVMTLDEVVEFLCEVCISEDGTHDITIDGESMLVCKECAKEIVNNKLDDLEFYGNIEIICL